MPFSYPSTTTLSPGLLFAGGRRGSTARVGSSLLNHTNVEYVLMAYSMKFSKVLTLKHTKPFHEMIHLLDWLLSSWLKPELFYFPSLQLAQS